MTPEQELILLIQSEGLPEPVVGFRWHPTREWHWDLCWPDRMLSLEVQGGGWVRGKHHRPAGYENDCAKLNEGQLLGWRVLWVTPEMLDGRALAWIGRALGTTITGISSSGELIPCLNQGCIGALGPDGVCCVCHQMAILHLTRI